MQDIENKIDSLQYIDYLLNIFEKENELEGIELLQKLILLINKE